MFFGRSIPRKKHNVFDSAFLAGGPGPGPWDQDQRPRTRDKGPGIRDQRLWGWDEGEAERTLKGIKMTLKDMHFTLKGHLTDTNRH